MGRLQAEYTYRTRSVTQATHTLTITTCGLLSCCFTAYISWKISTYMYQSCSLFFNVVKYPYDLQFFLVRHLAVIHMSMQLLNVAHLVKAVGIRSGNIYWVKCYLDCHLYREFINFTLHVKPRCIWGIQLSFTRSQSFRRVLMWFPHRYIFAMKISDCMLFPLNENKVWRW